MLTATFTPADPNYSGGVVNTPIDVSKAAPVLNWLQPAAIVHGTPLGAAQLNATASVPGTFAYSPAAGTVLNAGASQTLTATFTPADSANYSGGPVTATIDVAKAAATVTVTGGTFTYDGQPHPATGSVTGINGLLARHAVLRLQRRVRGAGQCRFARSRRKFRGQRELRAGVGNGDAHHRQGSRRL